MEMASRVDIRSFLMDSCVYNETCRVDGQIGPTDALTFFIHVDHVRDREKAKVDAIWVDPKGFRSDGV